MRTQFTLLLALGLLNFSLLFTGCMKQMPGSGQRGSSGGGGLLNSGTSSILSGATPGAGGSGGAGALTQGDTQSLQAVVGASNSLSLSNDANANSLGIDGALSQELLNQINQIQARERNGEDMSAEKWALVPKILEQCASKVTKLFPLPGQPLIGDWTGNGACGLNTFSINGPGNQQVYPGNIPGAQGVQVAAYNDGRFELRSDKWNGSGRDSGFQGQNLSGVGTLTTQISSTTKYGTTLTPCQAQVQLVTSRNPIPANYQSAVKAMGGCYRKALGFLGMDQIFKNIDPVLAQVLLQQMLK